MIVRVVPPHMGEPLLVPVRDASRATPALLAEYLQHEGLLPAEEPERPYVFFSDSGKAMVATQSLAEQEVGEQSTIRIEREGTAAALSPREIASRRAHDHRVMCASFPRGGSMVTAWSGYASCADAERGRHCQEAERVSVYDVDLQVKSPTGPGQYGWHWRVRIDASAWSYPADAPGVMFLTHPRPWNPHTSPAGLVCLGTVWDPGKLIAHLVVAVARILNFDEDPGRVRPELPHYNRDSIPWWHATHRGRPITALTYPVVRVDGSAAPARFSLFGQVRTG